MTPLDITRLGALYKRNRLDRRQALSELLQNIDSPDRALVVAQQVATQNLLPLVDSLVYFCSSQPQVAPVLARTPSALQALIAHADIDSAAYSLLQRASEADLHAVLSLDPPRALAVRLIASALCSMNWPSPASSPLADPTLLDQALDSVLQSHPDTLNPEAVTRLSPNPADTAEMLITLCACAGPESLAGALRVLQQLVGSKQYVQTAARVLEASPDHFARAVLLTCASDPLFAVRAHRQALGTSRKAREGRGEALAALAERERDRTVVLSPDANTAACQLARLATTRPELKARLERVLPPRLWSMAAREVPPSNAPAAESERDEDTAQLDSKLAELVLSPVPNLTQVASTSRALHALTDDVQQCEQSWRALLAVLAKPGTPAAHRAALFEAAAMDRHARMQTLGDVCLVEAARELCRGSKTLAGELTAVFASKPALCDVWLVQLARCTRLGLDASLWALSAALAARRPHGAVAYLAERLRACLGASPLEPEQALVLDAWDALPDKADWPVLPCSDFFAMELGQTGGLGRHVFVHKWLSEWYAPEEVIQVGLAALLTCAGDVDAAALAAIKPDADALISVWAVVAAKTDSLEELGLVAWNGLCLARLCAPHLLVRLRDDSKLQRDLRLEELRPWPGAVEDLLGF